jgi:hypothetical protein
MTTANDGSSLPNPDRSICLDTHINMGVYSQIFVFEPYKWSHEIPTRFLGTYGS